MTNELYRHRQDKLKNTWNVAWGLKVTSLCPRDLGRVQWGSCCIRLECSIPDPPILGLGGSLSFTVWVKVLSSDGRGRNGCCWGSGCGQGSRPPKSIRSGAGVDSNPVRTLTGVGVESRPSKEVVNSSTWLPWRPGFLETCGKNKHFIQNLIFLAKLIQTCLIIFFILFHCTARTSPSKMDNR